MENAENKLGGGPYSPEVQQEMERCVAMASASRLAQEVAGPTSPSPPQQIAREDLLEYKLLGSRAEKAELQILMYNRELQRSQAEANTVAHEAGKFMKGLGEKYGVNIQDYLVTDDGYLTPRVRK